MAPGDQGLAHLGGRQVRVPARRLQLRIGVSMGLDDRPDVRGQSRILLLAARAAAGGEVLHAAHPPTRLVQPLRDGGAAPAEATFRPAGAAAAEFRGDLGDERSASIPGEPSGSRTDQGVGALGGYFPGGCPPRRRDGETRTLWSRITWEGGKAELGMFPFAGRLIRANWLFVHPFRARKKGSWPWLE